MLSFFRDSWAGIIFTIPMRTTEVAPGPSPLGSLGCTKSIGAMTSPQTSKTTDFIWARVDQLVVLGMGDIPPLIGNPYNGYINPYYWVDDYPLLYGNNGSLDPSTYDFMRTFYRFLRIEICHYLNQNYSPHEMSLHHPIWCIVGISYIIYLSDGLDICWVRFRFHLDSTTSTLQPKRAFFFSNFLQQAFI